MSRDHQRETRKGGSRGHRPERRISVRGVRRENPDLRKLAQALIALAQAQAEADAQAERQRPAVDQKATASSPTEAGGTDSTNPDGQHPGQGAAA